MTDSKPLYTNGHKYSRRKQAGYWLVHPAPQEVYDALAASVPCRDCNARESVIRELLDALRQGWIDLKSNKMKRLERIAAEVTNGISIHR